MADVLWVRHNGEWRRAPQNDLRVKVYRTPTQAELLIGISDPWRKVSVVWRHLQGNWRPFIPTYFVTISAGTMYNFNLKSWLINNTPWDEITPVAVDIRIQEGAIIGSQSPSIPAFEVSELPQQSEVYLTNAGEIFGAGGRGGSPNGQQGGTAIYTRYEMTFENLSTGRVRGGGGGGGSAYAQSFAGPNDPLDIAYSNSGGGAGEVPGAGGYAVDLVGKQVGTQGQSGTTHEPGQGGDIMAVGGASAEGGAGGDNGLTGIAGQANADSGDTNVGAGGAEGLAFNGDQFVTYLSGTYGINGPRLF